MARRPKSTERLARADNDSPSRQHGAANACTATATGARAAGRWPAVDFFRGCAILAMIVYHFCFDLAFNGWLIADFGNDPRWIWFRTPILGSFLFIAGLSLGLARARGHPGAPFWRRVAIIAGAAGLVSLGSYLMFPESYIFFGVLHAIALMSILARPVLRWESWTMLLGLAVLVLGVSVQHSLFDQPPLQWVGMMTFKPRTEDYVPIFPWFGLMLMGAGAGAWIARLPRWADRFGTWTAPISLGWIVWLGRHSLAVYLLHQPIMLGAMLLFLHVR